jgi:hypothetical protein
MILSEESRPPMELDVTDLRTGKPIRFKINLGKVTLPHHVNLVIPPFKYSVEFAESAIDGDKSYGGMNYYAAKELKMAFNHTPDVVIVAKQTTGDPSNRENKLECTIAHEIIEAELMKTGLPYHIAHMYAMEYEKGVYKD